MALLIAPRERLMFGYLDVLALLHETRMARTYLEIGVFNGDSLRLASGASLCIGVDPDPLGGAYGIHDCLLERMTSDEFFESGRAAELLGERPVDLAFIDGMHLFEYALRDFMHVEQFAAPGSLIAVHDCFPHSAEMASRERRALDWTGDVWKLVLCLLDMRPDLGITIVDVPPSGLCLIRELDPHSAVLFDGYNEIVAGYLPLGFDEWERRLADTLERTSRPREAELWNIIRRLGDHLAESRSELRSVRTSLSGLEGELLSTRSALTEERARLAYVQGSESWRLTAPVRRVGRMLRRSRLVREGDAFGSAASSFMTFEASDEAVPPSNTLISVIVPVFNTPPEALELCVESVIAQRHEAWELCICDDCSTNEATLEALSRLSLRDARIKTVRLQSNAGIAAASNQAASVASGRFYAFLDHDDELHPEALAELAHAIDGDDTIDVLYTDEDKIEPDGAHSDPFFKPDWSPEYLTSVMYLLHCFTVRASLFHQVGGLRSDFDGAQDYDLALRACAQARTVHHIRRVLYHWRKMHGSASLTLDAKPYAINAGHRALAEASQYMDPPAEAGHGVTPGTYRLRRPLTGRPPVTLVVITGDPVSHVQGRGRLRVLHNFIASVAERSTYPDYRLLVVDDGVLSPKSAELLESVGGTRVSFPRTAQDSASFNYSSKVNFALGKVQTDHFVLLNDDLEVISPDWIESLMDYAVVPEVAGVGAHLLFADGSTQHAGVICKPTGPDHVFYGMPQEQIGYYGFSHVVRNYCAVTAAVMASRVAVVEAVGGFDEKLAHDFNDIDFCLRACSKGYRFVYTPHSKLYHFEHSSLKRHQPRQEELDLFNGRWQDWLRYDPYRSSVDMRWYSTVGGASVTTPELTLGAASPRP